MSTTMVGVTIDVIITIVCGVMVTAVSALPPGTLTLALSVAGDTDVIAVISTCGTLVLAEIA